MKCSVPIKKGCTVHVYSVAHENSPNGKFENNFRMVSVGIGYKPCEVVLIWMDQLIIQKLKPLYFASDGLGSSAP